MVQDEWQKLADHVVTRRVALGYRTRRQFAAALGISERTMAELESGRPVGDNTLAAVEVKLGWAPGSARDTLAGRQPRDRRAARETPPPPDARDEMAGAVISAVTSPYEQAVLAEVEAARADGVAEDEIFAHPVEAAIWGQRAKSEAKRAGEVAAFRAVQSAPARSRAG